MVSYNLAIHTTAKRELDALSDAERERLTDAIAAVSEHRAPTDHPSVRLLEGQDGLYRLRVGDLRAVLCLDKPELIVAKVGKRKDVYDNIDQIDSKRLSTIRP